MLEQFQKGSRRRVAPAAAPCMYHAQGHYGNHSLAIDRTTLTLGALFHRTGVVLDIAHSTRYVDAL